MGNDEVPVGLIDPWKGGRHFQAPPKGACHVPPTPHRRAKAPHGPGIGVVGIYRIAYSLDIGNIVGSCADIHGLMDNGTGGGGIGP